MWTEYYYELLFFTQNLKLGVHKYFNINQKKQVMKNGWQSSLEEMDLRLFYFDVAKYAVL